MANINQLSKGECCFTALPFSVGETLNIATELTTSNNLQFSNEQKFRNCSYGHSKILQAVCTWFESWQPWQHRIVFAGIINRLSKGQIRSLKMIVESVFHRDFIASCSDAYPMKKKKLKETTADDATEKECSWSLKLQTKINKKAPVLVNTANPHQEIKEEDVHTVVKKRNVCDSPFFTAVVKHLPVAEVYSQNAVHHENLEQSTKDLLNNVNKRNHSSREKQLDGKQGDPSTRFAVENKIKQPVEHHLESHDSNETCGAITSKNNGGLQQMVFTENNENRSVQHLGEESDDAVTKKSPSLWTMGPSDSYCDGTNSEFGSKITSLPVKPQEFFSGHVKNYLRGKQVSSATKIGSEFVNRLDITRNKAPYPTATQLYKSEKLWSSRHMAVRAKTDKLKENFRQQLNQIWNWIEKHEVHFTIRLLIELLARADSKEVKYLADCLKYKQTEGGVEDTAFQLLPDKFWLNVFKYLEPEDLLQTGSVCRRWFTIVNSDTLWIDKCKEIGERFGIYNLAEIIETAAAKNETLDWKQAYTELRHQLGCNAKKIELKLQSSAAPEGSEIEKDRVLSDDGVPADEESYKHLAEKYKSYKSFRRHITTPKLEPVAKDEQQPHVEEKPPEKHDETEEADSKNILAKPTIQPRKTKDKKKSAVQPHVTGADPEKQTSDDEQKHNKEDVFAESSPHKNAPAAGGFLEMWKSIKEELKSADAESVSKRSDWWYDVEVNTHLFSEEEVEDILDKNVVFAVDYKLPRGSYWLVNATILPVGRVQVLEGHNGPVNSLLLQGKRIFSGSADRRIRLWAETGETFAKMEDVLKGSVLAMAIGADDKCRTLYSASWDTSISVWDCVSFKRRRVLDGHVDAVTAVAVDGKHIISCSYDGTIRVWDIQNFRCERILRHHTGGVYCLTYKDRRIVSGGADKIVHIADVDTGRELMKLSGHQSPVTAVERQKNLVISGDLSGVLMFWSVEGDGEQLDSLQGHAKQVNKIIFHGGRFFTTSNDKFIKEWELVTLTCCRILQGHQDAVLDIKYNEKFLASCSRDGTIRLWWWDYCV